jgi:hypothetical protein
MTRAAAGPTGGPTNINRLLFFYISFPLSRIRSDPLSPPSILIFHLRPATIYYLAPQSHTFILAPALPHVPRRSPFLLA